MRRKDGDLFVARIRIEPETYEQLMQLFGFMAEKQPDGLAVKPPEDWHTAAFVYTEPFRHKTAEKALSLAEFRVNRIIIKPSGIDVKRLSVEVLRVTAGDKWPEDWFDENSIERLGAASHEVIEERKRGLLGRKK